MNSTTVCSRCGIVSTVVIGLAPPLAKPAPVKIGMLGVGLKMHLVWAEAKRRFREGSKEIRALADSESVELIFPDPLSIFFVTTTCYHQTALARLEDARIRRAPVSFAS